MFGSKRPKSSSAITALGGRTGGELSPLETASEYELQRTLETSNDRDELTQTLRERDRRLTSRAYTREFWDNAFYQETRKLRDNLGGEFVTIGRGTAVVGDYQTPHTSVRRVQITEAYSIGRFPVTEGAFLRFVKDGGYDEKSHWGEIGWDWKTRHSLSGPWLWRRYPYEEARNRFPMSGLTYFEAAAYCRWRTARESGDAEFHLPTSVEWEVAARGRLGRPLPWGYGRDTSRANLGGGVYRRRLPVNRHPGGVSPFGCWDMMGNTWELTADPWDDYERAVQLYEKVSAAIRSVGTSHQSVRSTYDLIPVRLRMRGGNYDLSWSAAHAAMSAWAAASERVRGLSFRIVRLPAID